MTSTLPSAIHADLIRIAHTVEIRNETKAAIAEVDSGIAQAQQKIDKSAHLAASALQGGSISRQFYASAFHQSHVDQMACHSLTKRLLEAHLQDIDSLYIEIEDTIKATILDVSGGDESLFALYVPERPADLSAV